MRALPRLDRRLAEAAGAARPCGVGRPPRPTIAECIAGGSAKLAQRDGDVAGERPAHADVDRLFDDDDVARPRERLAQRLGRKRPERDERHEADRDAVGAHLVDHVLDRAVDRSHRDDEQSRRLRLR